MQSSTPSDRIYRLTESSTGFFKDRGSKFYAYAYPLQGEEEIEGHIQSLKKKHYDARHHCTAWRLGSKGEKVYTNDDGEPGNSAGPPILAAIRSAELTNVLIVVVRYFGGTKLGIRGLIEAYRTAAEDAIQQGTREEIIARVTFSLAYSYAQTSLVNRILHRFEYDVVEATYTDTCLQKLAIREEIFPVLEETLLQAGLKVAVEKGT